MALSSQRMFTINCRLLINLALALWLISTGIGCSRKPPPPLPAPVRSKPDILGLSAYQAGRDALAANDQEQAQRRFREAIHVNASFTEAWYELGRLEVSMAPALAKTDELKAMVMFREGLEFEQQARKLIDEGKIRVWTPAQVEAARDKLYLDLRDADHALADEDSLREALRVRVY
jgi:hypothetical protein